jgi:hypothetical protein
MVTPSMRPEAISSLKTRRKASTARGASPSERVKPMEFSEEAWKIVETEMPSPWSAPKVRAAMPGTPIMPLPATLTRACEASTARPFTG